MPVDKLGAPILTIDRLKSPWGVAINQKGEVVVTEEDQHCVSVFSPYGEKIRSFGTDYGHVQSPRGVAVDGDENILVVDGWNNRIKRFTAERKDLSGYKGQWAPGIQVSLFHCIQY